MNGAMSAAKAATRTSFATHLPRLQIPATTHTPQPYSGPSYEDCKKMRENHISKSAFAYYKQPVMVVEGHMQYMYDHTGKRYLDLIAGINTVGVGHCHPRITKAVAK